MIRIVIIADTVYRAEALAAVLADDDRLDIVSATDEHGLTESAAADAPDVLVAAALSPRHIPSLACPVVIVSDTPAPRASFGNNVLAWLPLNSFPAELSAAIYAAACDLAVLTPDQLRQWSHRTGGDDSEMPGFIEKLTPRELQVLRMLADGVGNKEIAAQLGVSDHTVKFHVAQILAKLGAGTRTEAVTTGIRRGLVPI